MKREPGYVTDGERWQKRNAAAQPHGAAACSVCGFCVGDAVKMFSGLMRVDGSVIGTVHGTVGTWHAGCGHIVTWRETGAVTPLPHGNVEHDR